MRDALLSTGVIVMLLLVSFPLLSAEPIHNISLLGGRWNEFTIGVQVPTEPFSAHNLILQAMDTWNNAQIWFVQTYSKDRQSRYQLAESPDGQVKIKLVDFTGVTAIREANPAMLGNRFLNATMLLPLSFRGYPVAAEWFEALTLHEFGHVLGLEHTNVTTDLMSESLIIGALPSTLDLFAVSVLAGGAIPIQVTLGQSIPYGEVPMTAIPEFSLKGLVLIAAASMLSIHLVINRGKKNRRRTGSRGGFS